MYAAVVRLRIDVAKAPAAEAAFSNQILITPAEGFQRGLWFDPAGGERLRVVVFTTQQQAQRLQLPASIGQPRV